MATILVDYENVSAANGLKGVEYLSESDTLYIFYSQCCGKIRYDQEDSRVASAKVLYTGSLRQFGREDGVKIYQICSWN